MPDLTQGHAPPAYWQQFEDLTVGAARIVFGDPTPQKVGRQGQSQNGLDVLVQAEDGRTIGIQCKQRDERDADNVLLAGGPITAKALTDAVRRAESHPAKLDLFILATTAKPNRAIQNKAAAMTAARKKVGKFGVLTWSWGDYDAVLNRDARLQDEYYRTVAQGLTAPERDQKLLGLFAVAFDRPAFRDPLSCEHADNFKQALIDTQRLLATGDLLDREGRRVQRAIGGVRTLNDDDLRLGAEALAGELNDFRTTLLKAERNGDVSQHNDWLMIPNSAVQEALEDKRRRVVATLNRLLLAVDLAPLPQHSL